MKIKKDGRSINRDALEHLRIRAIKLWKKEKKVKDIAENFGVTKAAVYEWIKDYKKQGLKGLKKKKAKGAEPKLRKNEIKKLLGMIKKTADNYGFESPLWDCKKITQLIREKFGKSIHFSNVWRLLQKFGLTTQKPQRQAKERSEKEVKKWVENIWPKILAHARRWQAMIYFQDESAVKLTAVLGTTWGKKGNTPIVRVTGNRGTIGITSAISPAGRMVFRLEKETVNSSKHIEFLKQVQKNHPRRKIIIIEDKAKPHIAKEVSQFVETQKKKLAIYFLPSYSPELNPDEHVWAYLKGFKLKAHQAKSLKDFKPLVLSKMRSIQRKETLVSSFFY
ncbi:MAG: IS630 family transposase, partial [candidate division NC10 bacterium]